MVITTQTETVDEQQQSVPYFFYQRDYQQKVINHISAFNSIHSHFLKNWHTFIIVKVNNNNSNLVTDNVHAYIIIGCERNGMLETY